MIKFDYDNVLETFGDTLENLSEAYEIREKILESLLLFLEQLDQTICYSRYHCYFILVYNSNSANKGKKQGCYEGIVNSLDKFTRLNKYEGIYLKRTFVYSIDEFNKCFVM